MSSLRAIALVGLLAVVPGVGLAGPSTNAAFQPQLKESGGPKALYSIRPDQLPALFPINSTLDQLIVKYGKPNLSGNGVDKDGKPTSWAVYTYGRSYTHVDKKLNVLSVNRFISASLQFSATGTLNEASLSKYQTYGTATTNREATDQEVAQYLGAPEPLDLKVDTPPASTAKAPAASAPAPTTWKLGADISELRSEFIAKTGFGGRGVYVVAVDPKGLAAGAGLLAGDVIVKLNGSATPTRDDLVDQLKAIPVTTSLSLEIFRQGKTRTLTVSAQPAEGTISI